jgi:hypothetical protein
MFKIIKCAVLDAGVQQGGTTMECRVPTVKPRW